MWFLTNGCLCLDGAVEPEFVWRCQMEGPGEEVVEEEAHPDIRGQ